jgi:FMN reductase
MTKVVAMSGSLRSGSHSYQALIQAVERIRGLGAEVEVFDLRELTLPFCTGADDYPEFPDVQRLKVAVTEADAIVLATPEYHGSLSGVLKNALDLLGFDQFSGKVTGVISVLGGQANSNALNDLRTILRWIHAWVIPEQIAVGEAWKAFSPEGKLVDAKLAKRFDDFAQSLVTHTQKLR